MRSNKEDLIADFTTEVKKLEVGSINKIIEVFGTSLPNGFYKYFWLMRCIHDESPRGQYSSFSRSFDPVADHFYIRSTCRNCKLMGSCQIFAATQKPPENY